MVCIAAAPASADPTGEPLLSADSVLNLPTPGPATGEEIGTIRAAFGVSAAQAETSLAVERRGTKINIVGQLKQGLGSEYAGVWFDTDAGEFVVPVSTAGKTQTATAAATQMVEQEFSAASLGGRFRTEEVRSSEAELEAAQLDLTERLSDYFEAHLTQTALDPATNAVIVRVPESIDSQSLAEIEKIASASPVKVEVRRMPDETFKVAPAACNEAERKCDLPLRSGQVIYGGPFSGPNGESLSEICSDGFRANGNDGKKYVLTAGHCVLQGGHPGGTPIWSWFTQSPNEGQHSIGTTIQWHYDGRDWAKIDATGTWADTAPWPTIGAYWGSTQEYPISGEASSYKGQTLCHIGMNTGASCGIVKEVNVTVKYADGAKLNSMYEVQGSGLALGGGDSGGPVVASNVALGLVSGGFSASHNAILFFSDIMAANAELNTNIVGPGAPEAITGSASDILNRSAAIPGQINPHGMPTTYAVEYGIGGYTNSTTSLYAGAGQGFTAVEKVPLSGLEPATTYQYRIKTTNGIGSGYGAQGSFKTRSHPELVGYLPPTEITAKQAMVHASVRPNGLQTSYFVEYERESPYFGKETPLVSAGSSLGPVEVSQQLTGLISSSKYYYRIILSNEHGIAVGATESFTTTPPGWSYLSRFGGNGTEPGKLKPNFGIAVDSAGDAYVVDTGNNRVQKFAPNGKFLLQWGSKGSAPGQFKTARSIAVDPEGNVWVGEEGNQRIQEFSPTGTFIAQIGPNEGTERPQRPYWMTIGGNGKLFVADWANEAIMEYNRTPNSEGKYFAHRWKYQYHELGMATAPNGTVYFLSEKGAWSLMKVTSSGIGFECYIPAEATPLIADPWGLAIDSQKNFLVPSVSGGRVVQFGCGHFEGSFGTPGTGPGQMQEPGPLALTPSGLLFVGSRAQSAEIARWSN
jgi:hypothetical protein